MLSSGFQETQDACKTHVQIAHPIIISIFNIAEKFQCHENVDDNNSHVRTVVYKSHFHLIKIHPLH